jgi:protein-tyrosine phosphatase
MMERELFPVLFVCTANICRSPMAEVLFREQLRLSDVHGVAVSSAGFLESGHTASDGARIAVNRFGLSLRSHLSTQLNDDVLVDQRLILTMTAQHAVDVVGLVPFMWDRVFVLRDLTRRIALSRPELPRTPIQQRMATWQVGRKGSDFTKLGGEFDVADPYGGSDEDYRHAIDLLNREISVLVGGLLGRPVRPIEEMPVPVADGTSHARDDVVLTWNGAVDESRNRRSLFRRNR